MASRPLASSFQSVPGGGLALSPVRSLEAEDAGSELLENNPKLYACLGTPYIT